jgi:Uma2 family endonuclease
MVTKANRKHWTYADLRAIPSDHNRYEIIDGELLVTPSPSWNHQAIAAEIFVQLQPYVREYDIGTAIFAPADLLVSDDTVLEPDLLVVPVVGGRRRQNWNFVRNALLVVEILSPRTARIDRTLKRRRYQSEGVPEYWLVDGRTRSVERWRPGDTAGETLSGRMEWRPDPGVPPLVIDLARLFADAAEAFPITSSP